VLALLVVAGAGGAWYWLFLKPDTDIEPGSYVQLEIPAGSGTAEIAEILSARGVISNANMFRLQARLDGVDDDLKAGVYDLQTGMPNDVVVDRLAEGPPVVYVTVTIPEGFTIAQIAERLEAQAEIPAADFLQVAGTGASQFDRHLLDSNTTPSLEGYLFPKTYRIKEGSTAADVVEMMLDQFEEETTDIDLAVVAASGLTMHDWVTIASMIEREVRVPDERVLVSSVIYNRLDLGKRLEIDATIEYVLPGTRPRLRAEHLKIDSPYNTYMYSGLPPGPIASPGLPALQAAAAPASTDYIYYVLTSTDGSHTFTETYAEFQEAKRKSREVVP
jgi:UPF0755 protein